MSARRVQRKRRSSRRRTRTSRAPGASVLGGRFLALVALCTLGLAWLGVSQGPKLARQVWSLIGVRRVESHASVLRLAAAESGVDACLLAGVMYVESRGQVDAVSSKGARGLFQLLQPAAKDAARRLGLPEPSPELLTSDAALNTRLGAAYLDWLIGLEGPDLERVLVCYNAGRSKLARWEKELGGWENWRAAQRVRDSSGAYTYARDVLDFAQRFRERGNIVAPASVLEHAPHELPGGPSPAAPALDAKR